MRTLRISSSVFFLKCLFSSEDDVGLGWRLRYWTISSCACQSWAFLKAIPIPGTFSGVSDRVKSRCVQVPSWL